MKVDTINGKENAMTVSRMRHQITLQSSRSLPTLLSIVLRECIKKNVFPGKDMAAVCKELVTLHTKGVHSVKIK